MSSLSLVLCSRNDTYAGNSVWRLQTALNYLALQVQALDRQGDVEVIVADWGSSIPLREALDLTPDSACMTRFLEISPELAAEKQQDSPFTEVIANNAAIRRASGEYIGRIDQDTLVDATFLERFFAIVEGAEAVPVPAASSFMFVGRRQIPYRFAQRCPPLETVVEFVHAFRHALPKDGRNQVPWFDQPVGVVILHRDLWDSCRGYDERLLYWGFMETDLAYRISLCHGLVDLEKLLGRDVYHLSHSKRRIRVTNRRKNRRQQPAGFAPNREDWGLIEHPLELRQATPSHPSTVSFEVRSVVRRDLLRRYATSVGVDRLWSTALAASRSMRAAFLGDRVALRPVPTASQRASKRAGAERHAKKRAAL